MLATDSIAIVAMQAETDVLEQNISNVGGVLVGVAVDEGLGVRE